VPQTHILGMLSFTDCCLLMLNLVRDVMLDGKGGIKWSFS